MFSGIPLPKTVADVGPGGPLVTALQGMNALTKSNLDNQVLGAQAQYAPYTTYADAASKLAYANMLPYQIQAQVMSNPMMWMAMKDNPLAMKAMMDNFQRSIPQGNNIFGNVNMPMPGTQRSNPLGNGLMGMLYNKLIGAGQQQSPSSQQAGPMQAGQMPQPGGPSSYPTFGANNQATPQEVADIANNGNGMGAANQNNSGNTQGAGSPLVPSTRGGLAGVFGKMTAPYNQQIVDPGKTFSDPDTGQTFSAPTSRTATSLQTSINAAQRVTPQLNRIAQEAAPFLTASGLGKMQYQRLGNFFLNKNDTLPTGYAKFQSDLKAAPEALVKSYGLNPTNETIERMAQVIEPYAGETGPQYSQRILDTLDHIKQEQESIGLSQLYGGIKVNPDSQSRQQQASSPAANTGGFDPTRMLDYHYNNREEFLSAFNNLNPSAKKQVMDEMSRRGMK